MAKAEGKGGVKGGRKGGGKGQNKLHIIVNLELGESREITQRDWRERGKQLRAEGWVRVEEVEDAEETEAPEA